MNGEKQYEEFTPIEDEFEDTSLDDLKAAAFEYLLLNPGSDFSDWAKGLVDEYPTEVVDAFGNNPYEVHDELRELWESEYEDPKTGIYQDFHEWAEAFSNEAAVGIYYYLVDACDKLRRMGINSPLSQ